MFILSEYSEGLDDIHKSRYVDKIGIISRDPYLVNWNECSTDLSLFPVVLYPDIYNYLVDTKSAFTNEEMKAYKSLEAYNQAICGWVKQVVVKSFGHYVLVLGKVLHSQRLNEKPLLPWIICKKEGEVMSAHCTCIAGLTEVCTHVGAVLFSIDFTMQKYTQPTRTVIPAYWMTPTNRPVEPAPVVNIDFSSPRRKFCADEPFLRKKKGKFSEIPSLTQAEKQDFLRNIMEKSSLGSAAHLCNQPFANEIQKYIEEKKNFLIMTQYKEEYEGKSLDELQHLGMF